MNEFVTSQFDVCYPIKIGLDRLLLSPAMSESAET